MCGKRVTWGSMVRIRNTVLTPKAVDCFIKSTAKKALIQKRIHPHVIICHNFATSLLDKGNDLRTVQALMGHSHIRTTAAYLHSTDDRVEAIRTPKFEP